MKKLPTHAKARSPGNATRGSGCFLGRDIMYRTWGNEEFEKKPTIALYIFDSIRTVTASGINDATSRSPINPQRKINTQSLRVDKHICKF